jgi:hypothetical protein
VARSLRRRDRSLRAMRGARGDELAWRPDRTGYIEKEKQQMKALMTTIVILVGCVSLDRVLAQPLKASSEGPSVADTIMRLSHDWANAEMTSDVDRLSQIVADEWASGYPGHMYTKARFLSDTKSGKHRLLTCEFGPHEVKVLGDVAVVQGSVTETRDGYDGILHVSYTDVWVKRGNNWMVVRSLAKSSKN